jgi:CIC family chloride channel protein
MAAAVGAISGLGALLICELTRQLAHLIGIMWKPLLTLPGVPSGILIPTLGGVVVGLILYRQAQGPIGLGLTEVIESVTRWGGHLSLLRMLKTAAAAVICMVTGGAVGREEPIAQLGSALGSTLGQRLRLPQDGLRYLVASGAAGGIAVALHAPIAAVFFALEVVLAEYSIAAVSSVAIASISAGAIANMVGYSGPIISVPTFAFISAWELPL